MVQDAAHPQGWPDVSPAVAEYMRQAAEMALVPSADWLEELHEASLMGERLRPIAEDPALAAAVRRSNLANIRHWATANLERPGMRVPPNVGVEALATARDLVRRGLDESALDSYRMSYGVVWNRCMAMCFALTTDPVELRELLEVASLSISTFIEDTITAITEQMISERADLTLGTHAERRAAVSLILEGAPIGRRQAERQLGYQLTGPHTAAVIWSTSPSASDQLESAAELVMRLSGVGHRLTVVASAAALWVWLPVGAAPELAPLLKGLAESPDTRLALGRPSHDLEGFRRSHLDALATQRMLTRLTSPQQAARYEDVQLVALLTSDPVQAAEFVTDTLGELANADDDLQEVVSTYIREQCSTSRTADRLYAHRNTVVRRLARAEELLPRPLGSNTTAVGAALDVLRWSR